jgi:DNA-binding MarR family transcriptional regulator
LTKPATVGPPLIGALLRVPWESVREQMLAGLHERGFDDLHPAHLTVLQYPPPEDIRPLDLAVQRRTSKQALNHLLGQLERLGYLSRRPDPDDRRHTRVDLTDRGRAAIDAIREIVREVELEWESQLGRDRFAQLRTLLSELASCSADARSSAPLR